MELTPDQRKQLRTFAPDHLRVIEGMQREERRQARQKPKTAAAGPPEVTVDLRGWRSNLTLGEAADIEEATGLPFEEVARRSYTLGAALIWIFRRRDDPKFTFKQARQIPMGELRAVLGVSEDDDDEGEDAGPLGASGSPSA